jgi:hypothetical protein
MRLFSQASDVLAAIAIIVAGTDAITLQLLYRR